MKRSKYYDLRLPERGARPGEANDSADIEDLTYDMAVIDTEMAARRAETERLESGKATKLALSQHAAHALLDHPDASVTDEKLGERHMGGRKGLLQALLSAVATAVQNITGAGEAQEWDAPPSTTLAAAHAHANDAVRHVADAERALWDTAAQKLGLEGGALTGPLTLPGNPTQNSHAATKEYVDVRVAVQGNGDMTKAEYAHDIYGVIKRAQTAANAERAAQADMAQRAVLADTAAVADAAAVAQSIDGGSY